MSLLDHTPHIESKEVAGFILDHYGFKCRAVPLSSERDQNFRIDTDSGKRFVFKIANTRESRSMLECQNLAMMHIAEASHVCPRVLASRSGETILRMEAGNGTDYMVRLVSYLEGIPLGRIKRQTNSLLRSLGACVGRMDRELHGFDHPAAHRDFHWDLVNAIDVVSRFQSIISSAEMKRLVEKTTESFKRNTQPLLGKLRQSVIHNDANDYNVIVAGEGNVTTRNQKVVGIIDFGDMVFSHTVCNLAVAVAYTVLAKPDPLASAVHVVDGYHRENPLTEDEIRVLFDLVRMRLCMSICIAADQQHRRPDDPYLSISQAPIRTTLPQLAEIPAAFAEAAFRHACHFSPLPKSESVFRWISAHRGEMAPLLGVNFEKEPCTVFDLSVGSSLISGDPKGNLEPALTRRLRSKMVEDGVRFGIGRYNEPRLIYTEPAFASGDRPTDESRTVHLGMDFHCKLGTPVYAPLPGTVYAFADNAAFQDYGPVIILEHTTDKGDHETFYSLYGHLSRSSLSGLIQGKTISRGERIGSVGDPASNGGWTPHLHFQVIIDPMGMGTDFPGVCFPSQRHLYTLFSPDPNPMVGIPVDRFPVADIDIAETLTQRRRRIGPSLRIGYTKPVKVERGWMQYLYDENGRCFLDAYNNVPHVGHCHPRVVEAGRRQMGILNTNTRYLHDTINMYTRRLCETLPEPLSVCFILNSATEANELALRLARTYTGHRDMIVLESAYHGHTTSLIDISPYKHDGPGGCGQPSWVHTAPVPDRYRGPYTYDDPNAASKYADHVRKIIFKLNETGIGLAGFIAESCPSVAGQIFFPQGYLTDVYKAVRDAGGLCIADEVQTGYGRTGTHFYAFEEQGIVPDIMILGKPIGNGHPVSVLVTTPEIADAFDNGMEFFSTFGGNTVSCTVGLEVLKVVLEDNLQAHALRVGSRLMEGLHRLKDRYPIIGDVRGRGLFAGIELVRDRQTLEPADTEAAFVADRMRENGILMGTDGPYHNVIKIRPPMPFSRSNADFLVETMDRIFEEEFSGDIVIDKK